MIPPIEIRQDEHNDETAVCWLYPGTISDWAKHYYLPKPKPNNCQIEVSKTELV